MLSDAGSEIERLLVEENETFSPVIHVSKRIKQNLKNVDFGSNSDEEDDWVPEDVEEEFSCIECEVNLPLQVKLK